MTAEAHTHAFISVSPTRNLIAQASAVHRQTSASTSAARAQNKYDANVSPSFCTTFKNFACF